MQAVTHSVAPRPAVAPRPDPAHRYELSQKSKLVWDLFCIISGKVEKLVVDIYLEDGSDKEATTIWINSNAYLDGKILRYLAKKLPQLNELLLHTCGPTRNEFGDNNLIAFAKKRRHIQYLTLQGIPYVTAAGLLAMIRTLDSLVEFSTDFPIHDSHAEALLKHHPKLVCLDLTGCRKCLSPEMYGRIRHLFKAQQSL
ncbi:MAG: hypothetical protein LLG04_12065 [Parachlamydia sp.]|nr:hypothetical protein [Parachlamydia sp.]